MTQEQKIKEFEKALQALYLEAPKEVVDDIKKRFKDLLDNWIRVEHIANEIRKYKPSKEGNMKKRWTNRHKIIGNPMLRLLLQHEECGGCIAPDYHQQWKTFLKAIDLGFVTEGNRITKKGLIELNRLKEMPPKWKLRNGKIISEWIKE